jgi:hypothetical protein
MEFGDVLDRVDDASYLETAAILFVTAAFMAGGVTVVSTGAAVTTFIAAFAIYTVLTLIIALLLTKVMWFIRDRCSYADSVKVYTACSVLFTPMFLAYALIERVPGGNLSTAVAIFALVTGVVTGAAFAVRVTMRLFDVDVVTAVIAHLIVDGGIIVALNIAGLANSAAAPPTQGMPQQLPPPPQ